MTLKKLITILILTSIIFTATPVFASQNTVNKKTNGVESFITIMTSWGTYLARVTGSYAVLQNLFNFSKITRWFDGFIEQGVLTPAGFVKYILQKMNIDIFTTPQQQKKENSPEGTYSI